MNTPGFISNDGQVAIKYYQSIPHLWPPSPDKGKYAFRVRANICMSWIPEAEAQAVLDTLGGCCGEKKKGVYRPANESDVRRWTNNGGS